jgi:hypothetical protein
MKRMVSPSKHMAKGKGQSARIPEPARWHGSTNDSQEKHVNVPGSQSGRLGSNASGIGAL